VADGELRRLQRRVHTTLSPLFGHQLSPSALQRHTLSLILLLVITIPGKLPLSIPNPNQLHPSTPQLRALSARLLRNTYRHPFLVLLNFVASLCAAIAIGLIFRDSGARLPLLPVSVSE